eukprot:358517_1
MGESTFEGVSGKYNGPAPTGKIGEPTTGQTPRAILTEIMDDDVDSSWKVLLLWRSIKQRKWFKTFRSPIEFCATKNFQRPTSKEEVVQRLQVNSKYFLTNYMLMSA